MGNSLLKRTLDDENGLLANDHLFLSTFSLCEDFIDDCSGGEVQGEQGGGKISAGVGAFGRF